MNGLYRFRGLMLVALWQTAPPVAKTEDGKLQIGLGYGGSQIEEVFFTGGTDCAGNDNGPLVEHRNTHRLRSFGASVHGMITKRLRMGAAYSTTSADTATLSGGQVTGVIALEWKNFGVGTGFTTASPEMLPGVYLRGGPLNSVHVRLDFPDVSQPTSATGVGRLGIAYNQTDRGPGVFIGVPVCYTNCDYADGGVRADFRIPVHRSFDLNVSGFKGGSDGLEHWGFGAGINLKR